MGNEIKCVVWDLDNTLWDGVLLESSRVQVKPEIPQILKILDERGILNSIASKNNYNDAKAKLKEIGLWDYFLYPEIHWDAKSGSIAAIRKNLNIGIDTFMFVDDQEFELDEVKSQHPEVTCLCADKYKDIPDMPQLQPRFITRDSAIRRKMYLEDIQRNKAEENYTGPKESFLRTLNMNFSISTAREEDLKRAEELTVRTNQLNSTGRTYDYHQLHKFMQSDRHLVLCCELADRYGSYGKIGISLVELDEKFYHINLLLMSCRVMSRGVGTVLLSYIMAMAKKDHKKVRADFIQTDRNRMMYLTYKFAGFQQIMSDGNGYSLLEHDLETIQPFPPHITLTLDVEGQSAAV